MNDKTIDEKLTSFVYDAERVEGSVKAVVKNNIIGKRCTGWDVEEVDCETLIVDERKEGYVSSVVEYKLKFTPHLIISAYDTAEVITVKNQQEMNEAAYWEAKVLPLLLKHKPCVISFKVAWTKQEETNKERYAVARVERVE